MIMKINVLFQKIKPFSSWKRRLSIGDQFSVEDLAKGIQRRDKQAISRSITLLESSLPEHGQKVNQLFKLLQNDNTIKNKNTNNQAPLSTFRLGFTGAPGVGKSSLIETFGLYLVEKLGKQLAVLTIDPSSVKSGGSILGDKTRMPILSQHPNAYIRSSPNRGFSGGVIASTLDTIRLCELGGFDIVLVETVGVGQSELAMADLVDMFVLLVAPGIGDELQGLKKGIVESADMILVNKADDPMDPAANQTMLEYKSAMKFSFNQGMPKKVLPVSGKTGRGIEEAWLAMEDFMIRQKDAIKGNRHLQAQKWREKVAEQELLKHFEDYLKVDFTDQQGSSTDSLRVSAKKMLQCYLRHIKNANFGGKI